MLTRLRRNAGGFEQAALIGVLWLGSGCWGAVQALRNSSIDAYKAYDGQHRTRQEIAVLVKTDQEDTHVVSLDGRKNQDLYLSPVLEVLPGPHRLCVSMRRPDTRSKQCVRLDVQVEAGHTYELYAVEYTHKPEWYPALWDVTAELGCAERRATAEAAESLLRNGRKTASNGAEVNPSSVRSPGAACPWGSGPAPGSGEERSQSVDLAGGRKVTLTYAFDRYRPYVVADGADGTAYHVKLASQTSAVERVLGRTVVIGSFFTSRTPSFQPLGSSFAYARDKDGEVRVFEEKTPGSFEPCAPGSSPPPLE